MVYLRRCLNAELVEGALFHFGPRSGLLPGPGQFLPPDDDELERRCTHVLNAAEQQVTQDAFTGAPIETVTGDAAANDAQR